MKLINIGFGNMVNAERVVAVVSPESAPIKRIIREAEDKGKSYKRNIRQKNKSRYSNRFRPYCSVGFADGNGIRQT